MPQHGRDSFLALARWLLLRISHIALSDHYTHIADKPEQTYSQTTEGLRALQAALERGLELIAPSLPTLAGLPNDRTNELPGAAAAHVQQVAHARQAEVNQRDEEEGAEVSKRSCYDCCSKMSMRKINAAEARSPAAGSKAHKAHTGRASSGQEPRSGRDRRENRAGSKKRRADGRGGDYCRRYSPDKRAIYRGGYRGRSRFRKRSRGRSPSVSRSRSRTGEISTPVSSHACRLGEHCRGRMPSWRLIWSGVDCRRPDKELWAVQAPLSISPWHAHQGRRHRWSHGTAAGGVPRSAML